MVASINNLPRKSCLDRAVLQLAAPSMLCSSLQWSVPATLVVGLRHHRWQTPRPYKLKWPDVATEADRMNRQTGGTFRAYRDTFSEGSEAGTSSECSFECVLLIKKVGYAREQIETQKKHVHLVWHKYFLYFINVVLYICNDA